MRDNLQTSGPIASARPERRSASTPLARVEELERRQLLSSTVGYWRFENGVANVAATGTGTIVDSSGNGINGTPINGPKYSASVPTATLPQTGVANHRSMSFNGVNQRISIPDKPALALTKSLTLEAYFDVHAISQTNWLNYIVLRGDNRGGLDPYFIGVQKSSTGAVSVEFEICGSSNVSGVSISAPISLSKWYEVAGTLDDATGQMKLYLNGVQVASTTTTIRPIGTLTGAVPGLGIGNTQSASTAQYFNGWIDEVRISNTALVPTQFLNSAPPKGPTVTSLSVSPSTFVAGAKETLTANGVADAHGTVLSTKFYRESNGKAGLQVGTGGDLLVGADTSSAGGWNVSVATTGLVKGAYTYYAQAADNHGTLSNVASNTVLAPPPSVVASGDSIFWTGVYNQTSASPPTKLNGYFFSDRIFLKSAGDFTTGQIVFPGPASPTPLAPNSAQLQFSTGYYSTRAALEAAYPMGTYTTTLSNPANGASEIINVNHTQDVFSASPPALTAATFTGMQGLTASSAFTFNFNADAPPAGATDKLVYFTITDAATNQVVFSTNSMPATTTSVNVPANTLMANTVYQVSIDFSNRIVDKTGATRIDYGFDLYTNALFITR